MSNTTSIKVDRHGVGTLVVDGVDLSMSIAPEFTVTGRPGKPAVVTVNIVAMNLEIDASGAVVEIPDELAETLEALGWKRP